MLRSMAQWGMALSRDISQRSIDSPYHPELKHDPGRAYAAATRAVRLTLAMQLRLQKEIVALRKGEILSLAVAEPVAARVAETSEGSADKFVEIDRESIEREIGDSDEARGRRERDRENLIEGDDFEALLEGDVHARAGVVHAEFTALPFFYREARHDPGREPGPQEVDACVARNVEDYPHIPVPDFAPLRLGPPHKAEEARDTERIFNTAGA